MTQKIRRVHFFTHFVPNKHCRKNQNDESNRHDLFKSFLIFWFIPKPSTENKPKYKKIFK